MKKYLKKLRVFLLLKLKYKLISHGNSFYFGSNLFIRKNCLQVGNNVYIGNYCHISVKKVFIDDFTMLASHVSIIGGDHKYDMVGSPTIFNGRDEEKEVIIEKDVWVGHGATILHGVKIGEGSIIGAGSLVTKNIPAYSIAVGSPARIIKKRFDDDEIKIHSKKINNYKEI